MSYGLIARADGLHMIRLPEDFDIQMMSNEDYNDLLNNKKYRVDGVNRKLAIYLINEVGDYFIGIDYRQVHKLQRHEADILLQSRI